MYILTDIIEIVNKNQDLYSNKDDFWFLRYKELLLFNVKILYLISISVIYILADMKLNCRISRFLNLISISLKCIRCKIYGLKKKCDLVT